LGQVSKEADNGINQLTNRIVVVIFSKKIITEVDFMSKKMQTQDVHHEELVKGLYEQMKTVLEGSEQPIFIYLDDNHKACNNKFAALLGFKSPQEWAAIEGFLEPCVAEKSRDALMNAYWAAMKKMVASTNQITFIKKTQNQSTQQSFLYLCLSKGTFSRFTS